MSESERAAAPLKFGIESILERETSHRFPSVSPALATSISPRDLSRKVLPSWIFCTRYSDRPSSGSRGESRNRKRSESEEERRPRTAFTQHQLNTLRQHFVHNQYLTEKRRQLLAHELGLNESQIKIWFQNKRAKLKKSYAERSTHSS